MSNLRHLRALGPPLGGYLRPGHRDAALLANLVAGGFDIGAGVVLDPAADSRTEELRAVARGAGIDVVIDPRSVELSLPGGFARRTVSGLPWAADDLHSPASLRGQAGAEFCAKIAVHVIESGATSVLAPTHFLNEHTPWLTVDVELTALLRQALDDLGASEIAIYYPLVSRLRLLADGPLLEKVMAQLSSLVSGGAVDAVWLRLHPFGTKSAGPVNMKRYIRLAARVRGLGVPVVGEKTGTVGLVLLALNAIGAIESSVTYGDRFDASSLLKPSQGTPFTPPPRVYLDSAGVMVERRHAEALFERRAIRSRHVCQAACCQRGMKDMIGNPRRHFVLSRSREVALLSRVPAVSRPESFLANWLRPATDRAVQLEKADANLAPDRLRLDSWRVSMSDLIEDESIPTSNEPLVPDGRLGQNRSKKAQ
ncbi:MAG: hypothetical protein ACC652_03210 [Acidimicrobiales bacterium]